MLKRNCKPVRLWSRRKPCCGPCLDPACARTCTKSSKLSALVLMIRWCLANWKPTFRSISATKDLWKSIRASLRALVRTLMLQEPDKLRRLQVVKPKQPRPRRPPPRGALNLRQVWKRSLQPRPSLSLNQLSRTDVELAFQIIHRLQKQKPSKPQPHHLPPNLERLSPDQWAELWHLLLQLQAEQRHSPVH